MTLLDLIKKKSAITDGTIVDLIKAITQSGDVYIIEQGFHKVETKLEFDNIVEEKMIDVSFENKSLDFNSIQSEIEFEFKEKYVELI